MIHRYTGIYVTCDEPGCGVRTGGICPEHQPGERGEPLARWDTWSVDGKHFCHRHHKEEAQRDG